MDGGRWDNLSRLMRIKGNRGVMEEVNGIALLYELGDIGYGVQDWICKGHLFETQLHYKSNCEDWLNHKYEVDGKV